MTHFGPRTFAFCWRYRCSAKRRDALLSTSVSDFLPDGVGGRIGRAEEKYVRPMLPMGAVSTKPAAAGCLRFTRSIFIQAASAVIRTYRLVARAKILTPIVV